MGSCTPFPPDWAYLRVSHRDLPFLAPLRGPAVRRSIKGEAPGRDLSPFTPPLFSPFADLISAKSLISSWSALLPVACPSPCLTQVLCLQKKEEHAAPGHLFPDTRSRGIEVTPEAPLQIRRSDISRAEDPRMSSGPLVKASLVTARLRPTCPQVWNPGHASHVCKHWDGDAPC